MPPSARRDTGNPTAAASGRGTSPLEPLAAESADPARLRVVKMLQIGRGFLIAFWLAGIAGLLLPEAPVALRRMSQLVLVVGTVHVIEFLVYRASLRKMGGSLAGHFVQTLFFGLLYLGPLQQRHEEEAR